jgi:methylmalonyl-CoA/ethylmalonyl-CoA epimerase
MSHPQNLQEVIAICNTNKRKVEAFLNGLPHEITDAPSTPQNWAVRDHLSHLATWSKWMIAILRKQVAWDVINIPSVVTDVERRNFDDINAFIYDHNKHLSHEDAYDYWQATHAELIQVLKTFTYEELGKPYGEYQPHEAHRKSAQYPLYSFLGGGVYDHYLEHLPWMQALARAYQPITVNHLAIVVEKIEAALPFWRDALGLPLGEEKDVPSEAVQIAFLNAGEAHIELVQPTTEDSGIAQYLAKKGSGMHHVCFEVNDIVASLAHMTQHGITLINAEPKERDGRKYAFIHPKSTGGVLVELYERL